MPRRLQIPIESDFEDDFIALAEQERRSQGQMGSILIREAIQSRNSTQKKLEEQLSDLVKTMEEGELLALLQSVCGEILERRGSTDDS